MKAPIPAGTGAFAVSGRRIAASRTAIPQKIPATEYSRAGLSGLSGFTEYVSAAPQCSRLHSDGCQFQAPSRMRVPEGTGSTNPSGCCPADNPRKDVGESARKKGAASSRRSSPTKVTNVNYMIIVLCGRGGGQATMPCWRLPKVFKDLKDLRSFSARSLSRHGCPGAPHRLRQEPRGVPRR